jgi:hypothetical protein
MLTEKQKITNINLFILLEEQVTYQPFSFMPDMTGIGSLKVNEC